MRTRVLVISSEHLGERMAGPAIRALELARVLADHCEVSIAAPAPSTVDDDRIALVEAGFTDYHELLGAIERHDVVVAQQLPTRLLGRLARMPVRLVADLYNPTVMEVLEYGRQQDPTVRRRLQRLVGLRAVSHAATADFILCASERQRDLWLGGLAMSGLLHLADYEADPSLRRVIDVVAFGLPERAPEPGPAVLKGVWPGIGPDDRVLLWGGGVWNWLDPITAIDAAGLLAEARPAIHLFFLGMARPSVEPDHADAAAARAREHARERGLYGTRVHFNDDWVPYADRGGWLLEADLGVSAHLDHLESRFSFRTRILDCLWASLPVVCTRGDALADIVEGRGLGLTVAPGDAEGLASACRSLLDDPQRHDSARAAIAAAAPDFRWSAVAQPLVDYCVNVRELEPLAGHPRAAAAATVAQYPDMVGEAYAAGGAGAAARRLGRNLARRLGSRG